MNAFALMASDSDFTSLVMRQLESGFTVYGFGEQKTQLPFVVASPQIIYTEHLGAAEPLEGNTVTKAEAPSQRGRNSTAVS